MEILSYREAIRRSMRDALSKNPDTIIYGLGVTDHTGIFGTTHGLEKEFGSDRVFDTPLAEDSMTGLAVGASLGGLYPIHIHIRNDFLLLAMNQIVNSIAKYKSMYGGLFQVPMLIRAVIGRSWGQGGQHSQSLQSLFAHIPGLTVIMPSSAKTVLDSYAHAIHHFKGPVISLEHRLLYDYTFNLDSSLPANPSPFTSYKIREGKDLTVVATSVMVEEAIRAAEYLKEHANIDMEIIDMHCMTHPNQSMILESVRKTGRLIVGDSSWAEYGVCAEIARLIVISDPTLLKKPVINLSMAPTTCPTAKALEEYFYPNIGSFIRAAYQLCLEKDHKKPLPTSEFIARQYKEFKGPF